MSVTTVPVERLFSVTGQVVTSKRNRLSPETVTVLVFLHESLPVTVRYNLRDSWTPWKWTGMYRGLMMRDPRHGLNCIKIEVKG